MASGDNKAILDENPSNNDVPDAPGTITLDIDSLWSKALDIYKKSTVTVLYYASATHIRGVRLTSIENLTEDYSELRCVQKGNKQELSDLDISCPIIPKSLERYLNQLEAVLSGLGMNFATGWVIRGHTGVHSVSPDIEPVLLMFKHNMENGQAKNGMSALLCRLCSSFKFHMRPSIVLGASNCYAPLAMKTYSYISRSEFAAGKLRRRSIGSHSSSNSNFGSPEAKVPRLDLEKDSVSVVPPLEEYITLDGQPCDYYFDKNSSTSCSSDLVLIKELDVPSPHVHVSLVVEVKRSRPKDAEVTDFHEYETQLQKEAYSFMLNQTELFGLLINAASANLYRFWKGDSDDGEKMMYHSLVATYSFATNNKIDWKQFSKMLKDVAATLLYMDKNACFCTLCDK